MVKVIGEDKLQKLGKIGGAKVGQEYDVQGKLVVCVTCAVELRQPQWGKITTEDLDVLELENSVYNIEIVQRCPNGHLNRMIYADNLSDETLMIVEKTE